MLVHAHLALLLSFVELTGLLGWKTGFIHDIIQHVIGPQIIALFVFAGRFRREEFSVVGEELLLDSFRKIFLSLFEKRKKFLLVLS